jgi:hypothetical protein
VTVENTYANIDAKLKVLHMYVCKKQRTLYLKKVDLEKDPLNFFQLTHSLYFRLIVKTYYM